MRDTSTTDLQRERTPDFAHHFAAALIDAIARAGVKEICICPGSRSTALALAVSQRLELRSWSQIDERGAAFFALGIAKASRAPVALICTSGTAAANFHPAIVEAYHAHVPLIVLSADRPPELRDWGAGQTIDQVKLYGTHVRWYAELAVPEGDARLLRYARAVGCRAVAEALGPPRGPVHLNLPFREPLEPTSIGVGCDAAERARAARGGARAVCAAPRLESAELDRLAQLARECERGVIACGPLDADARLCEAIARLGAALGWPILADATSQLRCGEHVAGAPVIGHSDLFLRDPALARAVAPEVVLRFGATPVSRSQRLWLEHQQPEQIIAVDPERAWSDPSHLASEFLQVDPLFLCESLLERTGPARRRTPWLESWASAERSVADALARQLADADELCEPRAVRELASMLPEGALLYVSNSMPVRDLDAFLPVSTRPLRVLANRGASGIDGMLSSALGAAAAQPRPVVLLVGDLALIHDLGALQAAQRHALKLGVVVFDNGGGGIFSYLPIAQRIDRESFEAHFRTPHAGDLGAIARGLAAESERVTSWEHFRAALKAALAAPGVSIVEVPIDRDRSIAHHRELDRRVGDALARGAVRP